MDYRTRPIGTLESAATIWGVALLVGVATFALLLLFGNWTILQATFGGLFVVVILGVLLGLTIGRPASAPMGEAGEEHPTAPVAAREEAGTPGQAARPPAPRKLNAPSPHRESIEESMISDIKGPRFTGADARPASIRLAEPAPATRVPAPAPVNAADPGVARPVGATSDPKPQQQPTPLNGAIVSPEPPEPIDPARADAPHIDRNDAAMGAGSPTGPTPSATKEAQSYNEIDSIVGGGPETDAKREPTDLSAQAIGAHGEATKPATLDAPRDGRADDLKKIKGVGPKLEATCNRLGFWHYDQIANWTEAEVAWVDEHLEGFKGRVSRDGWVEQARTLAGGDEAGTWPRAEQGGVH